MLGRSSRGVSILEVLFAILITAIGLMGAIAVFPAAMLQAKRGMQQDAAAASGLSGISAFDATGMRQPARWLQFNQASTDGNSKYQRVTVPDGSYAFCIDPRFFAAQMNGDNPTMGDPSANNFPYGGASIIQRVTLDSGSPVGPSNNPIPMRTPQADLNFLLEDDLDYNRFRGGVVVTDDTLQAAGNFARDGSGNVLRRQSDGHLSWMATLSPKLERLPTGIGFMEDRYVLSVVVFYDRPTQLQANMGYDASEWSLGVTFNSGGINGGEVRLADTSTALPPEERYRRLNIQRDQWIMLASYTQVPPPGGGTARTCPQVRWYRVIDTTEPDPSSYTVDLTLAGADWETTNQQVFAVVCQGAIAVFEKTIKLEPRQ